MCLMILEKKDLKSDKSEKYVTICLVIFSMIIFYIEIRKICPSPSGIRQGDVPFRTRLYLGDESHESEVVWASATWFCWDKWG